MRAIAMVCVLLAGCATTPPPGPSGYDHGERAIFDAHRHAFTQNMGGKTAAQTLAEMDAAGIDRSVIHFINREMYDSWDAGTDGRILRGVSFPCWKNDKGEFFACTWGADGMPDLAWLRAEAESGRLTHLGEMGFVYAGMNPDDPKMAPYWALAEEFGLPVMVHINRGPPPDNPMRKNGCCPNFNPDMGNPLLYAPILDRHPRLKLVLQHYGFPALPQFDNIGYIEESVALLDRYPTVMLDMSTYHSVPFLPAGVHAATVQRLKAAGFIDRVMFATDNWPAQPAIDRYLAMDFLTEDDRKAIFHDNAARLFGVD